jgi:acyl-CoA hydrolase
MHHLRCFGVHAPVAPSAVLDHIAPRANLIVPIGNGEPVALLDVIEQRASSLDHVTVHQMHALRDREYFHGGRRGHLDHVSYFLSEHTRRAYYEGTIELVPADFSDVPALIAKRTGPKLVIAACSMPDADGFVSLGTGADYAASFIDRVPFFLEANPRMPRTHGGNRMDVRDALGWTVAERPLVEIPAPVPDEIDCAIAGLVADLIPDRATIQIGIGRVPNAILAHLGDRTDLGIHSELLSDAVIDLIENGAVTGRFKASRPGKVVATFCLGSQRLYDFVDDNPTIELWPVDWVNDPHVVAQERSFVSVNATTEVDLLGQCASETMSGRYWSGSGGQADFARGAILSAGGQGFIVLRSQTHGGRPRVVSSLTPGSVVTTGKNTVDHVVTEHGIASLRGLGVRARARALIAIAHPTDRERLESEAQQLQLL